MRFPILLFILLGSFSTFGRTDESAVKDSIPKESKPKDVKPSGDAIRKAIRLAIPLLEKGSAGSAEKRTCFTCHNQAVPVIALTAAKKRGFEIDQKNLDRQINHTLAHLQRGKQNYQTGNGQGGRVLTAGYALWALEAGDRRTEEITQDVAGYLLRYQNEQDHYSQSSNRPPTSGSNFTASYVAIRGLSVFGTKEQSAAIQDRLDRVGKWLLNETPADTEDHVFRLFAMRYLKATDQQIQNAKSELLKLQHESGGWAQKSDMAPDSYATATALTVLLTNETSYEEASLQKGIRFLLEQQLDDGSWHVKTRAKGFQTYFESGYPHEKDQFLSISAASWATYAMLLTLDP